MIQELLDKYKDQKPIKFGENHMEKCYPVSAVIAMLEEQKQVLNKEINTCNECSGSGGGVTDNGWEKCTCQNIIC